MAAPCGLRIYRFLKKCHFLNPKYKFAVCQHRCFHSVKILVEEIGEEKAISLEFGRMARFADGSVVAKCGDTAVLVAVTSKTEALPNSSFLPLTVDYRQKAAAAGRIPTNHLRRELGPTDKEILTSRVIDRSLRSLFPSDYFNETLVTCNLLSVDGVHDPDVVSINAASAALLVSDIPWNGPVGCVRVGCSSIEPEKFIVNPTRKEQQASHLNLVIATDKDENVVMLEGEANNLPYAVFKSALEFGATHAATVARELASNRSIKMPQKRLYSPPTPVPLELLVEVERIGEENIKKILSNSSYDKVSRDKALQKARHEMVEQVRMKFPGTDLLLLHEAVSVMIKQTFRDQIAKENKRCDGRGMDGLRQISCAVDLYAPLHGSAIFQRGQTQVLSTVTFDSLQAAMKADPISVLTGAMKEKNFMLHYEFPSYATNEVKAPGIKNRRELGHGALAEKGLRAVIPDRFPFSIRLTAEVLESNGSSSMASICAGTLALMDAGVDIKEMAAGVAIGLVTEEESSHKKHHLMSDILGIEDYFGDMDMKVGGTKTGVTAIQMDLKTPGIPVHVVNRALALAKEKIKHIITIMKKSSNMSEPRPSMKDNGPVIENINVPPAKRGSFLGIGGINLKKLQSETGVTVTTIDESNYEIFAPNKDAMVEAKEMMAAWLEAKKEPMLEFGAVYEVKITEIRDHGVMVQIHPAMDPVLLPNSQLDHRQVSHPSALGLEVGQTLTVKYFGREPATGKIRLSRKVLTALSGRTFKFMKES